MDQKVQTIFKEKMSMIAYKRKVKYLKTIYSLCDARIHFVSNVHDPALCVTPDGARYVAYNLHDAYQFFEDVL